MLTSEYKLVPINSSSKSGMSPELWGEWWDGKIPHFEYDDIILENIICNFTPPKGNILEGGCGLGRWVELLRNHDYSCIGVDFSGSAIKRANHFFPKCTFRQSDITKLNFLPDESIDTYLSLGVFEHFREGPSKPLLEAYRVLKPGGVLLCTIPNYSTYKLIIKPFSMLCNYFKSKLLIQKLANKPPSKIVWFEYQYSSAEFNKHLYSSGFIHIITRPLFVKQGIHMASRLFRKNNNYIELNLIGALIEHISKSCFPSLFAHMNLFIAIKPYAKSSNKKHMDLNEVLGKLIKE